VVAHGFWIVCHGWRICYALISGTGGFSCLPYLDQLGYGVLALVSIAFWIN
jgi:hypothetical protein